MGSSKVKLAICPGLGIALRTMGRFFNAMAGYQSDGSCFLILLVWKRNAIHWGWAYNKVKSSSAQKDEEKRKRNEERRKRNEERRIIFTQSHRRNGTLVTESNT